MSHGTAGPMHIGPKPPQRVANSAPPKTWKTLRYKFLKSWRMGWDSNPRDALTPAGFQVRLWPSLQVPCRPLLPGLSGKSGQIPCAPYPLVPGCHLELVIKSVSKEAARDLTLTALCNGQSFRLGRSRNGHLKTPALPQRKNPHLLVTNQRATAQNWRGS